MLQVAPRNPRSTRLPPDAHAEPFTRRLRAGLRRCRRRRLHRHQRRCDHCNAATARRERTGGRRETTSRPRRSPSSTHSREPRARAAHRLLGPAGIGRLEGAAHGQVQLHGPRRSGAPRSRAYRRADGGVRRHRQLGREHRRGLPDAGLRRQRLARLAGAPREHRERELHRDRLRRRGELFGPDLLGSHLQHGGGKRAASASASAAASASAPPPPARFPPRRLPHRFRPHHRRRLRGRPCPRLLSRPRRELLLSRRRPPPSDATRSRPAQLPCGLR